MVLARIASTLTTRSSLAMFELDWGSGCSVMYLAAVSNLSQDRCAHVSDSYPNTSPVAKAYFECVSG